MQMGPDFHICLVVFATFCFQMNAQAGQRRRTVSIPGVYALQYCSYYHAYIARLWPIGDCDIKERSGVSSSLNFTKLSPSGQPGSPTRSLKFVLRKVILAGLFHSFLRRDETDVF